MIDLFYYTINTFGIMFPPKVFCICVLSIKIKEKTNNIYEYYGWKVKIII